MGPNGQDPRLEAFRRRMSATESTDAEVQMLREVLAAEAVMNNELDECMRVRPEVLQVVITL